MVLLLKFVIRFGKILFKVILNSFNLSIIWDLSGVINSAVDVGVGALLSATKSIKVVSVSWPIADIIGIVELKTARTTIYSLKGHKSSIDPPPLATIRGANNFRKWPFLENSYL